MQRIPIPNNEKTIMDPNYRYQRDRLIILKSGEYSVMDNLDQICNQLMIDKSDIISFIPKYLKQSVKMFKTKVGTKINSDSNLEDMLEYYIVKNIICPNCSLPEINMNKCSERYMTCNSCGQDNSNKNSNKNSDISKSSKVKKSTKELKQEKIIAKKQAIIEARKSKTFKKSEIESESESESESISGSDSESNCVQNSESEKI